MVRKRESGVIDARMENIMPQSMSCLSGAGASSLPTTRAYDNNLRDPLTREEALLLINTIWDDEDMDPPSDNVKERAKTFVQKSNTVPSDITQYGLGGLILHFYSFDKPASTAIITNDGSIFFSEYDGQSLLSSTKKMSLDTLLAKSR